LPSTAGSRSTDAGYEPGIPGDLVQTVDMPIAVGPPSRNAVRKI